MLLSAHLFVTKRCQSKTENSVLLVIAVMAGIVLVVIVVVEEAIAIAAAALRRDRDGQPSDRLRTSGGRSAAAEGCSSSSS